jgi:benzoylformate decarboxylase
MPGVELGGIDFASVARGLGVTAHVIESPEELRAGLRAALTADGPTLLHVKVDPDPQQLY